MRTDPATGEHIETILARHGLSNMPPDPVEPSQEQVYQFLGSIGYPLDKPKEQRIDDTLAHKTAARVLRMYRDELFSGLNTDNFPACATTPNTGNCDQMVVVLHCPVKSVCEHHLMPFHGSAAIGYIPGNQLLGLSKFPRVVNFYSRRPQIQERLTEQIFHALTHILETYSVAVTLSASHMCMTYRGAQVPDPVVHTSKLGGVFLNEQDARREFYSMLNRG